MSSPDEPQPISQGPRTALSLWLFIHFFGVLLALATLTGYGGSELLVGVKQAVRPYLQPLWLDVSYDYYLTYGGPEDGDAFIEAELTYADGKSETTTLPDVTTAPPGRRGRYQRLAATMAAYVGDPDRETVLPAAVGAGLLKQTGAKQVVLRYRRHVPLTLANFRSLDEAVRDPHDRRYYETLVSYSMRFVGGELQLSKVEAAGEVAPVSRPRRPDRTR